MRCNKFARLFDCQISIISFQKPTLNSNVTKTRPNGTITFTKWLPNFIHDFYWCAFELAYKGTINHILTESGLPKCLLKTYYEYIFQIYSTWVSELSHRNFNGFRIVEVMLVNINFTICQQMEYINICFD